LLLLSLNVSVLDDLQAVNEKTRIKQINKEINFFKVLTPFTKN
jgi:hypothetical protein